MTLNPQYKIEYIIGCNRKDGMKFKIAIFYRNEKKSLEIVEAGCTEQKYVVRL